jgi:hypothetical protein
MSARVDKNNAVATLLDACEKAWWSGPMCLSHKRWNDIHRGIKDLASFHH